MLSSLFFTVDVYHFLNSFFYHFMSVKLTTLITMRSTNVTHPLFLILSFDLMRTLSFLFSLCSLHILMQLFPSLYLDDVALHCLRLSLVFIQATHVPSNIGILSNTCHLIDSDLHLNISASHLTYPLHIPTHFTSSHSLSPILPHPIPFIPAYPHPIFPHPILLYPFSFCSLLFSSIHFHRS